MIDKDRLRLADLWPSSWHLRAYLLVVLAEAAGDIAIGNHHSFKVMVDLKLIWHSSIESYLLAKFEFFSELLKKDSPDERAALPVYLGIFVLAQ